MSKVTLVAPWDLKDVVAVDCGHFIYCPGATDGDEVDCPVCREKAAAVKAARLEELGNVAVGSQSTVDYLTKRIAELEAS